MAVDHRTGFTIMHCLARLCSTGFLLFIPLLTVAAPPPGEDTGPPHGIETAPTLHADGGGGEESRSLDDVFIDMVNPYGPWFTLFNHLEHTAFQGDLDGAGDQSRLQWDVTASWPFLLDSGRTIVARVNFPINLGEPTYFTPDRDYAEWGIRQDAAILPNGNPWFDGHGHLADISWELSWGGVSENGWITGVGLVGVLPTRQDGSIERDQYLLGPDVTVGRITDWGILGARLRHYTNVADVSNAKEFITWDTNETHLQVFFGYQLGNRWSIISNPRIVLDWEADSGNDLLLPLGGGVSRMTRWFGAPVKMDLEFEYFVASADIFGPEWLVRFSLSPAILDRSRR